MRRLALSLAAMSLLVAACSDDSTSDPTVPTTAPPPSTTTTAAPTTTQDLGFTVMSDDGRVSIDVPPESLSDDPGISITGVAAADRPTELDGLGTEPLVYSLGPDGLEFDAPVRVTARVPIGEVAPAGFEAALPMATLITTTGDGTEWAFLDDLRVTRDADSLIVSGLTDHFSGLAAISEQIFIQTRFVEITPTRSMTLGFDFLWSNGVPLNPPEVLSTTFIPTDNTIDPVKPSFDARLLTLDCPPDVTTLTGDIELEILLRAVSDTSGETGLVSAPRIATLGEEQATITFVGGTQLLCRPTITADGSITMDVSVDHPDGAVIVPDEDFKSGLSAIYIDLGFGLPPLFVGLIRDVDGDGRLGPDDIMYPPEATDITNGASTVVLPLFGFGDYFTYFLTDRPPGLETEVLVRDGATILLGGIAAENTAVPYLGDVPFITRVFSEESRQVEQTELVIFLTPQLVENTSD